MKHRIAETEMHSRGVPVKRIENKPIWVYAQEIEETWPKVSIHARPYLDAMHQLDNPDSTYGCEDAKSIVTYFLCNASTWRGYDARRIKQELRDLFKA